MEKAPEYDNEIKAVKPWKSDKDELQYIFILKQGKLDEQFIVRISDINYPERYTMVMELEGMQNTTLTRFIELDHRSTKMQTSSGTFNFFLNMISFFVRRKTRKKLIAFKKYAELNIG
ncbi:MAG TPA: hypothetical protein VHM26_16165 [Chitinophagaceae bacterium]|nr:hypothetical protein [Chitinophagaceae bacterium]